MLELRPSVTSKSHWAKAGRSKIPDSVRKVVLTRDNSACQFCGHQAGSYMNLHHLNESGDDRPENLVTVCVACHAVLHFGRNLALAPPIIEIWASKIPQVEIVRQTRAGIVSGKSLADIKAILPIERGPLSPDSLDYANDLLGNIGKEIRISLPEPLCAVFVSLKRWQI